MPAPAPPAVSAAVPVVTAHPHHPHLPQGGSSDFQPRPKLMRQMTKEDFDIDVSNMQVQLDSFKDILSSQISIDTSMITSLYDADNDSIPTL